MYSLNLLRYEQQLSQLNAKQVQPKASTEVIALIERDPASGDLIESLADGGTSRRARA